MSTLILRGVGIKPLARASALRMQPFKSQTTLKRLAAVRFQSTSPKAAAATPEASASSVGSAGAAGSANAPVGITARSLPADELELSRGLTWEQFFQLKRTQRRIGLGSSVIGSVLLVAPAWWYISQLQIDPTETILGMDQMVVYIGGMMATAALGYVLGPPTIGDLFFRLTHRSTMRSYVVKQQLFMKHIAQIRPDASRQSMNNPVPDYYGEKIGSLKDYRQWLRDCNEYRRKATEWGN